MTKLSCVTHATTIKLKDSVCLSSGFAFADTYWWLFIARSMQGLSNALVVISSKLNVALGGDTLPKLWSGAAEIDYLNIG